MPSVSASARKHPAIKLALVALVVIAVVLALFWRRISIGSLIDEGIAPIRAAGPWAFFGAMVLLPAVGVPVSPFSFTAPAFADRMGMGGVVAAALGAITVNMLLTYWLSRKALRPLLARLLERMGYKLPQVEAGDMTDLIVLLRVTPGPPFFIQNYLLGLAGAPIVRYLVISCAAQWAYAAALVVSGYAALHGRAGGRAGAGAAVTAAALFIALAAAAHLVRRHYGRRKASA